MEDLQIFKTLSLEVCLDVALFNFKKDKPGTGILGPSSLELDKLEKNKLPKKLQEDVNY